MTTKIEIVNTLIKSAESNGLIPVIYSAFGKSVKVRIPLSTSTLNQSVDDFDFSVRSSNCLKRSSIMQIRDIVSAIEEDRLLKVRNLGKTSYREIQTKLLALAYSKLSETEKKQFFLDLMESNSIITI